MCESELEYERDDKELLEKCYAEMEVKTVAVKRFKKTRLRTRRKIEDLMVARQLNESISLSI